MRNMKLVQVGTLLVGGLLTTQASAQITGSAHDFSGNAWSGGEICLPCHTPHNALSSDAPLWNHELTTATYTMYGGGSGTAVDDFDIRSRMCLSCHDGTVALDSVGGATGTTFMTGQRNLTQDLSDDHPVGSVAQYPPTPQPAWWASEFKDATTFPAGVELKTWTDPTAVDHEVVSCATCHDPHNAGNHGSMLVVSNAASTLCLSCHIK